MLNIEITQEDLDNGIRESGENCAIALAMKRVFNCYVDVAYNDSYIEDLGFIPNGLSVQNFILDFDNGRKCIPMTFQYNGRSLC